MVLELIMVGNRQAVGLGDDFSNRIRFVVGFFTCIISILGPVNMSVLFLWEG